MSTDTVCPSDVKIELLKRGYKVGHVIGEGGFGCVYEGFKDNIPIAIKCTNIFGEVSLLYKLQHIPNIIHLYDFFYFKSKIIIIMERNENTIDLYDFINNEVYLDEKLAQTIFEKIVKTIIECHESGIVHRDIKDENILINKDTKDIKIIDFGGATKFKPDKLYKDFGGTMVYSPPEWNVYNCYYGEPATVWSLGVLLYRMVVGYLPFHDKHEIVLKNLYFEKKISKKCKELISDCLRKHGKERPSLKNILKYAWMRSFL